MEFLIVTFYVLATFYLIVGVATAGSIMTEATKLDYDAFGLVFWFLAFVVLWPVVRYSSRS